MRDLRAGHAAARRAPGRALRCAAIGEHHVIAPATTSGVPGAVDVFTAATAFTILGSIRLDLGYRMDVHLRVGNDDP